MDYEKAYKEALERARAGKPMNEVFPELHESEDERIRKNCIHFLQLQKAHHADTSEIDDCIAYLEKLEEFQFGYPGIYFYDGEKLHFQGNPAMEEKPKEPNPSTPIEREPVEKQDYSGLTELERAIHRAGVENVPVAIIKGTAQECRLVQMKSAEWSEEDEEALGDLMWCIKQVRKSAKDENDMGNIWSAEHWLKNRIKSLRPQPHWKPSEEQMRSLEYFIKLWGNSDGQLEYIKVFNDVKTLYNDLKKML